MSNPVLDNLADKANRLPLLPGVYIMLDGQGQVIYVGKAKKLKNRVSSYFHGEHLPKVAAMVDKVRDFNVIVAGSEFEALVLENSLIKRHKPHYNILLKDDKGYPFIRLDLREEYPSMSIQSRAGKDGARYFGPARTGPDTSAPSAGEARQGRSSPRCRRPCCCRTALANSPGTSGRSGPVSTTTWAPARAGASGTATPRTTGGACCRRP